MAKLLTKAMNSSIIVRRTGVRYVSGSQFYSPTLTERRAGQGGKGGRTSEAGVKVALFGASGFLGGHVAAELGT